MSLTTIVDFFLTNWKVMTRYHGLIRDDYAMIINTKHDRDLIKNKNFKSQHGSPTPAEPQEGIQVIAGPWLAEWLRQKFVRLEYTNKTYLILFKNQLTEPLSFSTDIPLKIIIPF